MNKFILNYLKTKLIHKMKSAQLVIKLQRFSLLKSNENFTKFIQSSKILENLDSFDLAYYPRIFESFINANSLKPDYERIFMQAYYKKLSKPQNMSEKGMAYNKEII